MSKYLVFASPQYAYLQNNLIHFLEKAEQGVIEKKIFPDGEIYHRIVSDIQDKDVIFIADTSTDAHTISVYDIACAMVKYGANSLILVIPYFGYSTMERAVKAGEVVKAKTRARLFSNIPKAPRGNHIFLIDLHSEGIPHYFEGDMVCTHLYAKPLIIQAAQNLGGEDFVLASTDAGRAKWVESLAAEMQVQSAFVYKTRLSGDETKITGVNAPVQGKTVVIYDDMIRTGGSLMSAAAAYLEHGADKIFAIATHLVLPEGSLERIKSCGFIQQIAGTNTHPNSQKYSDSFLKVYDISPLIADAIHKKIRIA
ncbi:MAG: ribose-phosphate diphosphokinase [Bacteroidia bacterium]|nr:ribose-phosphate diphosphokinase [Bacteroidia bacterium]MDW8345701.1 ribose-phosphate diphosphokinase [Bacteroidia bacterium]